MTPSPVWIREKQRADNRARNTFFMYLVAFAVIAYIGTALLGLALS